MLRAHIFNSNIVTKSFFKEKELIKSLHHSLVELNEKSILFSANGKIYKSAINFSEKDSFTETYLFNLDDIKLRLIKPIGLARTNAIADLKCKNVFSIGNLDPDGFSFSFFLTDENDLREINKKSNENQNEEQIEN